MNAPRHPTVTVRLSPEARTVLDALANYQGRSILETVKRALLAEALREAQPPPPRLALGRIFQPITA